MNSILFQPFPLPPSMMYQWKLEVFINWELGNKSSSRSLYIYIVHFSFCKSKLCFPNQKAEILKTIAYCTCFFFHNRNHCCQNRSNMLTHHCVFLYPKMLAKPRFKELYEIALGEEPTTFHIITCEHTWLVVYFTGIFLNCTMWQNKCKLLQLFPLEES